MLLLVALLVGSTSSVWADEDDVHDLSITRQTGLNNNASILPIEIDDPGYTIKQVQVGWKYNKAVDDIVTIEVTIGETSLGTQTVGGKTSNVAYFNASDLEGDITISFTNHAGDGTGKGTFYIQSVKLKEGAPKADYWRATYVYNDGVTANKVVNVNKGDDAAAYTLEAAPTRSNFDFLGWSDGTNTYEGGAAYALTSNKTFTAQWEYAGPCTKYNKSSKSDLATGAQYILVGDKSGTNHFALNDLTTGHLYFGSSAVTNANSSITSTKAIIVDEEPLVLTLEETADGWYLKDSSGNKLGMTGEKQMNWDSGDMTWVLGGSDDIPTFKATYSSSDYTLYYNSSATRFNAYTSKGSNVYAYFYRLDDGKDVYSLILDFNYGTIDDEEHRVLEGASYTLPTPTRSGYAFTGWNTEENGTGINYPAGAYVMPDDDAILYAQWSTTVTVTIGDSGFASYCSAYALDFSESDVNAYAAKVSDNKVVLTKVDEVPANEGVVLYCATSGNYDIPVIAAATAVENNEMVGVTERTQVNETTNTKYNYILQSGQFNKANGGYLKANRAYLSTTYQVQEGKELSIVFNEDIEDENETNGIRSIKGDETSSLRYNLAGQKVSKDYKGIVIINGKKMLNK